MSTYNGARYLQEQIDSILEQSVNESLMLYVRDDGSTDDTSQILDSYQKRGKLVWNQGNNVGPAKSFLALLMEIQGYDYYAFCDQDDVWNSNKVSRGIKCLEKYSQEPAMYCSNASLVDQNLRNLNRNVYRSKPRTDLHTLSCAGGLLGCTMLFNDKLAEIIRKGGVPEQIVMHDFYCALVCVAQHGRIVYDDYASLQYRQHNSNTIGVPTSFVEKIRNRMIDIASYNEIGIAEQAATVLDAYGNDLDMETKEWLLQVAQYRHTLFQRLRLSMSKRTHYISTNMAIKLRLSILAGNR